MNIPMTDLAAQYARIKDEVDAAMQEVIGTSGFILGKQVSLLEEEVARYHGVRFAAGVASGTDALVLSLAALGIGKGDEVITTPFTFIATAEAISRVGATPVFCDIEAGTFNIDVSRISAKVTSRTKALLPVHLYGLPCGMNEVMALAKSRGLKVIEDCAQSFGSVYAGKKTGSIGDCGCLSFFPAKTLGCYGDGGMVVTDNEAVHRAVLMLRNHGSKEKYIYSAHGFNSRLDTLQAAILRVKLKYVDTWIAERQRNAQYYNSRFADIPGVTVAETGKEGKNTFNYYTLRVGKRRGEVEKKLKEKGIPTAVYYPLCLHLQEVYKDLGYRKGDFPVAEAAQEEVLSLPMYPELKQEQMDTVIAALRKALS